MPSFKLKKWSFCLFKAKISRNRWGLTIWRKVVGSQIKQLFGDQNLSTKLNAIERRTWEAFENVCKHFLGNKKTENYSENVQELISSYSATGCNMSLKLHFLHFYFNFFLQMWEQSPMNLAKFPSRHFPHGKRYSGNESKYIGWLLLKFHKGDTKWQT